MLVTGHEYGEITVWRDVNKYLVASAEGASGNHHSQVTKTTLHWHAHAGECDVCFVSLCQMAHISSLMLL